MDKEGIKENLDVKYIIRPYLSRWYWFVLSVILAAFLAFLYIKFTQPVYKIQSSVLVKDAKKMSGAAGDFGLLDGLSGLTGMGTNSIENELEVFRSKRFADEIVKDLGLQTALFSREQYYDVELYKETSPFLIQLVNEKEDGEAPEKPMNISANNNGVEITSESFKNKIVAPYNKMISLSFGNLIFLKNPHYKPNKTKKMRMNDLYFVFTYADKSADDIQNSVDVDLADKEATIIQLSTNNANKQKAKDILDGIVSIYNNEAINDKNTESKKSKDFIDNRIELIGKELSDVENEKERFKQKNNIVDIPTEVKLNLTKNAEIDKEILELSSKIELTNMLSSFLKSQNSSQVLPLNIVGDDNPSVATNIASYNRLVLERNRLLESGTAENPIIKEISSQISNLKYSINETLAKSKNGYEIAKIKLVSKMNQVEGDISEVPTQEKVFRNIERNQKLKESLYLLLLEKREEAAISLAMTANKARVVDNAYALIKPEAPKKLYSLLGALVVGLLIPFGCIYVKELTNNKIVDREDLEKNSDITVVAEIPRLRKKANPLIQQNDVSSFAEAFRIMMTNIKFLLPMQKKGSIILVTSSVKGEGKTFVSMNLGLTLANSNNRVLIIGSDIRNPQLQRYNEESKNSIGLTEFLVGGVSNVKEIIHKNFSQNCDVIYSGAIPPNPTLLLENGRYKTLLDEVKDNYDYIILDSAPLMLVTDSSIISKYADVTLYVTRSEVTEKSYIRFANKNEEQKKLNNVTFVLNGVHKSNFGYGNTYGYGYNADEKKWWQIF